MSNSTDRPNPDQLLEAIQRQENREKLGKLKIFLGMAPGVGKTYAMLRQAQDLKEKGIDVVVGLVETHGRKETIALIENLDILPRISVPYRGITMNELDLDAIIKRRPQLVLVDELAHTNAPDQRHKKRYQDVLEILDAGIDVFTTLNIQHLESRSEIVREITGVKIQETLPDSFLDSADEIILIDLDPEELLKRLREGKIYTPDKAAEAAQNFFQVGHLTALRELALRATTERVDQELQDIRRIQNIDRPWKATERLLVAVFASPYSEKLIRRTRILASAMGAGWFGAYVETPRALSEEERVLLGRNLALVRELGGTVLTTMDENAAEGILRLSRENNISQIIVGRSKQPWWNRIRTKVSLVDYLLRESKEIDVYVVTADTPKSRRARWPFVNLSESGIWRDYALAMLFLVSVSGFGILTLEFIGYRSVGILYLLAVAILALFVGRIVIWFSAVAGGFLWDFLFIPPTFAVSITHPEDYMLITMFIVTAAITGQLMARLRRNQQMLSIREQRASSLYSLTRQISSAQSLDKVVETAVKEIETVLSANVAVLIKSTTEDSKFVEYPSGNLKLDEKERSVALWVVKHSRQAGRFTDTLPSAKALYIPLTSTNGTLGVLGIQPKNNQEWTPELQTILDTFVQQLLSGIEREFLHELARKNVIEVESERLSKIILNTVSHELETPLSNIDKAAQKIVGFSAVPSLDQLKTLGEDIEVNTKRLSRLVDHLLDMSRLEVGELKLKKQITDLRSLINKTISKMQIDLHHHHVKTNINQNLPDLNVDPSALEQVITNIIDNFVVHTAEGSHLEIECSADDHWVTFSFRDNGTGLPGEDPNAVFGKFFRATTNDVGGGGLGLSIARGLVEAHGGTMKAQNRSGGGAEFTIRLPILN